MRGAVLSAGCRPTGALPVPGQRLRSAQARAGEPSTPSKAARALGKPPSPQELSALRAAAEKGAEISWTSEVLKGCPEVLRLVTKTPTFEPDTGTQEGSLAKAKGEEEKWSPTPTPAVSVTGQLQDINPVAADPLRAQIFPPQYRWVPLPLLESFTFAPVRGPAAAPRLRGLQQRQEQGQLGGEVSHTEGGRGTETGRKPSTPGRGDRGKPGSQVTGQGLPNFLPRHVAHTGRREQRFSICTESACFVLPQHSINQTCKTSH